MTEHIINPSPTGLTSYTDATPRIRAGTWFYATLYDGWTCTGGRVYVPAGSTAIGQKIRISAYRRTTGMPASNDTNLNVANAIQTKVVNVTAAGWVEARWDTPFTFANSSANTFIFIGYEILTTADAFTGIYFAGGSLPPLAQQSPTLAGMWLAEQGIRGMYAIGAAEDLAGPVNGTWYGADILVEDNAVVTGDEVTVFDTMVAGDFNSVSDPGTTYNLSTEFYVTRQAWLTKVRLMMPTSGGGRTLNPRQIQLWQVDSAFSGTKVVGNLSFTPASFGQWVVYTLSTPYELTAGQRYRVAYRVDGADGYVAKATHFNTSTEFTNDYLAIPVVTTATGNAQGAFNATADAFPTQVFNDSFYGIAPVVVDSLGTGVPQGSAAFTYGFTLGAVGHTPGYDSIRVENQKAGEDPAQITISGAGDLTNLGFARQFSTNHGETVEFSCTGAGTVIDIYRIGYYGNAQWHKVTTITNTATTQPTPNQQGPELNGGYEASNWSVTAHWDIPEFALSGLYVGVYRSNPGPNASYIPFLVRNDERKAQIVYKVSETTWGAAYNNHGTVAAPTGGKNVYGSNQGVGSITDRTHFVSFMRPIITRQDVAQTYWMACEMPLITWLERNGYDVKYISGADLDRDPTILEDASIFISSGHDEYWSDQMRKTLEDWRLNSTVSKPTHALFLSGNEVFWRIRFNAERTGFYCYKDTMPGPGAHVAGQPLDPVSWTGTWRDTRWANRRPEWYTTGTDFRMNGMVDLDVTLSRASHGSHPVWDNTALENGDMTLTQCIGFEADQIRPTQNPDAVVTLASAVIPINGRYADDNGQNYSGNGSLNPWGIVAQRIGINSVTVGFGTCQWSWLLSDKHDRYSQSNENANAQQMMVNLLGDLGAQPDGLQVGIQPRTAVSLDYYGLNTPPEGSAQFNHSWTLTSAGRLREEGAAQLGYQFVVSASGVTVKKGRADLSHSWTVSVQGRTPVLAIPQGAAAFTYSFAPQVNGDAPGVGAASFQHSWNVLAEGDTPLVIPTGRATLGHSWVVQVSGVTPVVAMKYGAAAFSYRFNVAARGINGQGLRGSSAIHMQVSSFARDHIRQRATDLMNCRVRITRPGSAYDPVTRRDSNTEGELLYEGPARVWEVPAGQQIVIGDDEVTVTSTYLSLPFWVYPLPEDDDLIVVIDSDDPDLTGRSLNVESTVRGGGLRASRRFQVTVSTSKKTSW